MKNVTALGLPTATPPGAPELRANDLLTETPQVTPATYQNARGIKAE